MENGSFSAKSSDFQWRPLALAFQLIAWLSNEKLRLSKENVRVSDEKLGVSD